MIIGDTKKIDLSISSFERMITEGNLYVDKTRLIENFLGVTSSVHLVVRQRRLGKSLNMDMLRCFLTDSKDMRHMFKGLYIESSPVWSKANSAPVFYFDFKGLESNTYKEQIINQVDEYICSLVDPSTLTGYLKRRYEQIVYDLKIVTDSLKFLTEITYKLTGKRSYLLIDEYDKLLMDNYRTDKYVEIRDFETALLSAVLKGNHYLEKALLTGVMRVSHESMFSGLNNIVTFDIFGDDVYTNDYGLTEEEVDALNSLMDFDKREVRAWYNGVKVGGKAIYNTYSTMSFLARGEYECYWGKSGTLEMIIDLLNDRRKLTLAKLLNGEQVNVPMVNRISLKQLTDKTSDEAFYSLLVQGGYLALDAKVHNKNNSAVVTIPNAELIKVWREFILENIYSGETHIRTLFDDTDNLEEFASNIEYFLTDRLSYYDLASYEGESKIRTQERIYHIFILGILSAYNDVRCRKPLSNRESGDGRYDILVDKPTANYIFEFKICSVDDDLASVADKALAQIEAKRYGAELETDKRLVKIGVAIHGKLCKVKCS